MLGLDRGLEASEAAWPELGEERLEGLETLRSNDIEPPLALLPDGDEAGFLQYLQVLRDRLLADVELRGDLSDRPRLVAHQLQHRPAARLGQRAKDGVRAHHVILAEQAVLLKT
jgi:hypothetical protein